MATERLRTVRPSGQGGDYTSLAAWEAGEQADLPALDEYRVAEIDGTWSAVDSVGVSVDGWTTDPTRYVEIRCVSTARHAGVWSTSKYILAAVAPLAILEDYVRVYGLQLYTSDIATGDIITSLTANTCEIILDGLLMRGNGASTSIRGFRNNSAGGTQVHKISNCVAFGFSGSGTIGFWHRIGTCYIHNCTTYGIEAGYNVSSGRVLVAKNCLAQSCTDGFAGSGAWTGSTNNCSDIASDAPGTSPRTGTVSFVDAVNGDFHLQSGDTVARDFGADLSADSSYPIAIDFDGDARSGSWDIGADEYTADGGSALSWSGSDAIALGEAQTSAAAFASALADALALGDSASAAAAFASALSDALSIGESAAAAAAYVVAATDGMAMVDQVGGSAAFAAALSDAITLADTYASAAALVRVISDALVLDELVAGQIIGSGLAAQISDAIALGDTATASAMFARALADALSLDDTATTAAVFAALISEGLSVTDAVATAAAIVRAVSDDIALGELLAAYMGSGNIPALRGVITALRMRATITDQRLRGRIEEN